MNRGTRTTLPILFSALVVVVMLLSRHCLPSGRGDLVPAPGVMMGRSRFSSFMIQTKTAQSGDHLFDDSNGDDKHNRTTTLWLTTCDSSANDASNRQNNSETNPLLEQWWRTARLFQKQSNSSLNHSPRVEIRNLCDGVQWKGLMTKQTTLYQFLHELIGSSKENGQNDEAKQQQQQQQQVVMFTDSDSVFNAHAFRAREVLERYDQARQQHRLRQHCHGGNDGMILFSAEPSCWAGGVCDQKTIQRVYPGSQRSSCNQFLNSGQFMGPAGLLLTMLEESLALDEDHVLGRNPRCDQAHLQTWYAGRLRHDKSNRSTMTTSRMVALDVESLVFRNLMFGVVDASHTRASGRCHPTQGCRTCGVDAVQDCADFLEQFTGFSIPMNPNHHDHNNNNDSHSNRSSSINSYVIQMAPVPGCPSNSIPFSIHGAGGSAMKAMVLHLGLWVV